MLFALINKLLYSCFKIKLIGIIIKWTQIFQSSTITKMILILKLEEIKQNIKFLYNKNHITVSLSLTSVCTIAGRWARKILTVWNTSNTPSYCIRSKTILNVINTPVRPTPALQCTVIGPSWPNCSFVLCTWPMKSIKPSPDLGTPCSGQSINWNCRTVREEPSRASVTYKWNRMYMYVWVNVENTYKIICLTYTINIIYYSRNDVSLLVIVDIIIVIVLLIL